MITAKPFKIKGLRQPRVTETSPKPDLSQGHSLGMALPPQTFTKALNEALIKIEESLIPNAPPRLLSYEKFNKLVYYTITGTGGIDARHCDLLIKEFMVKYNYCFPSNHPDLAYVLKKLVEQGKIDKVKVNKRNYYYNLRKYE